LEQLEEGDGEDGSAEAVHEQDGRYPLEEILFEFLQVRLCCRAGHIKFAECLRKGEVVATAIIDLAKVGQTDPERLAVYAASRAQAAIARACAS
jgi:hypothetical protein